ncbi:hypothetical protein DPV78_006178 [Talaromyces pinophilus]|nr:hypothetical protein DPV78_006178 [Talaromyces pinophilus]
MKPRNRPKRGPPASAAHRYMDPASGNDEHISAITAAVMNVKKQVTKKLVLEDRQCLAQS